MAGIRRAILAPSLAIGGAVHSLAVIAIALVAVINAKCAPRRRWR